MTAGCGVTSSPRQKESDGEVAGHPSRGMDSRERLPFIHRVSQPAHHTLGHKAHIPQELAYDISRSEKKKWRKEKQAIVRRAGHC